MGLGLVIKLLGAAQPAVLAALFGAGPELDAYFVAVALPNLLITFLVLGPAGLALTSSVVRWGGAAPEVSALVRAGATLGLVSSLTLAAAGYLAAPWVIATLAPGFDPETAALSVELFRVSLPVVVLATLGSLARSVLHAYQRFLVPVAAYGIGSVVSLTVLATFSRPFGIYAAPVAMVAGAVPALVMQWWAVRTRGIPFGFTLPLARSKPEDRAASTALASILPPVFLLGLSLAAIQGIALWGRFYASQLGPGNLALLEYGLSFDKVVAGLVAGSAATAAYPTILAQAREGLGAAAAGVRRSLRVAALTALPMVALLAALREPVLLLWLGRGRFTGEDVSAVAQVVLFLAPAFAAWSLAYPLLYAAHALHRLRLPFATTLAGLASAGLLGFLGAHWGGLPGVAAALSLAACGTVLALFWLLARDLPALWGRHDLAFLAKLATATAITCGAVLLVPPTLAPALRLVLGAGLGVGLYLASLKCFRVEEVDEALRFLMQRAK